MCFAVYIGTDQPLPTSQWDAEARSFYLAPLTAKDEPVRMRFSKQHVYYAGSHLQCSCGFFHNSMVFNDDSDMMQAYEDSQRSARALAGVLEQALSTSDSVEVFVTWEGRQTEPPARRRSMAPEDFLSPLRRYAEDSDEEIQVADSPVEEQDFIVVQKRNEGRTRSRTVRV